ncbi:MAG TPA: hypothetical protein VJ456_06320, partial [Acidimicrobiia bacterium]|nr:hypothetical protein [Acidimicrobiia bacterium]
MGRMGALRARWSGLPPRRRAGVAAVAVAVTAGLIAVGAVAGSGGGAPAPVIWRDHVADPTVTSGAPSSPASTADGRGAGDIAPASSTTVPGSAGPGSTTSSAPATPPGSSTAKPTTPGSTAAGDPLAGLRVAAEGPRTGYDRALFGSWIDADADHCNTREEVLEEQSTAPVVEERSAGSCKVLSGDWLSAWDGRTFTDPAKLQIDHVVPLAEAWDSGAAAWDAARRLAFANDLADPELMAVSAS